MNSAIWLIARQEILLGARNRWIHWFSGAFAALTLGLAYFGMVTSGYSGFQDFTRTAASITELSAFIIPLFALLLGVFSFLSHREYLELLVAQPLSRGTVFLGKYLGLVLTVVASTAVGLGLPGVVVALAIGTEGALQYAAVMAHAALLGTVFCGISTVLVLWAGRQQVALGWAIGVWLFFEVLYDVAMLGSTLYFTPAFLKSFLLVGLLGNPVDIARVLSLLAAGGPHLFGPGGATLVKLTGSATGAAVVGWMALGIWVAVPAALATRHFRRLDI